MLGNSKNKKLIKIIISYLCISCLLFLCFLPNRAVAGNQIPESKMNKTSFGSQEKTEIVYATLDGQGTTKDIYIVNHFTPQADQVIDYGNYSEVQTLSLQGDLDQIDNQIKVKTGAQDYYYKGKLKSRELPWAFTIIHRLNGQIIKPKELSGATGKWSLELSVKPNSKLNHTEQKNAWAAGSMLQITLTLSDNIAKNIKTENGLVAEAGSNRVVNFMHLPDADLTTFTVEADITDFYLPAIQIAATPFSTEMFNFNLPDFSENEDLKTLQDATEMLSNGSKELAQGMSELNEGADQLEESLNLINDAGDTLNAGGEELIGGVKQYTAGIEQLSENSSELRKGVEQAAEGSGDLVQGLGSANQGLSQYTTGVSSYVDGVNQLTSSLPELNQGAQDIITAADQIAEGFSELKVGNALVDGSNEIAQGLSTMAAGASQIGTVEEIAVLKEQLSSLPAKIEGFATAITEFTTELNNLKNGLAEIVAALRMIETSLNVDSISAAAELSPDELANPSVQKIFGYLAGVQSQLSLVTDNLSNIEQSIDPSSISEISEGLADLSQIANLVGLLDLASGVLVLNQQYETFDQGLTSYIQGVNQLSYGYKNDEPGQPDFYSGLILYLNGIQQISTAIPQIDQAGEQLKATSDLAAGYSQLESGLADFSQGLNSMSSGVSGYTSGVDALANSSSEINSGLNQYTDGTNSLLTGLSEWSSGFNEFTSGIEITKTGSSQLADGVEELHRGTSEMDDKIAQIMDDILVDYENTEPMPSFASADNPKPEQVQFVIMTEPIPKKTEIETPIHIEPEKNIWDRFLDLFR